MYQNRKTVKLRESTKLILVPVPDMMKNQNFNPIKNQNPVPVPASPKKAHPHTRHDEKIKTATSHPTNHPPQNTHDVMDSLNF